MRMSGHKTRAVFERYNVVAEEDLRDAVQRIEGARLRQKTVKVSKEEPEDSKAALGKYREGLRFPSCGGPQHEFLSTSIPFSTRIPIGHAA